VLYSSNPLSKKCHFGHVGGADRNLTFVFQKTALVTTGKSKERKERISKASMVTLREIISDGLFETDSRTPLSKLVFLFGDAIDEDDRILHDGDYKWFRQIGNRRFFLPFKGMCSNEQQELKAFILSFNLLQRLPLLSDFKIKKYRFKCSLRPRLDA